MDGDEVPKEIWENVSSVIEGMSCVKWYLYSDENIEEHILNDKLLIDISAETVAFSDEKQEYLNSLSYLMDLAPSEKMEKRKEYYDACLEERNQIYQRCIESCSPEELEILETEQHIWQENLNKRIENVLTANRVKT